MLKWLSWEQRTAMALGGSDGAASTGLDDGRLGFRDGGKLAMGRAKKTCTE